MHRARPLDEFMGKIEKLVAGRGVGCAQMWCTGGSRRWGFTGGERTTRRAVAEVKARHETGHRRVFRPWILEPCLWLQFDWGEGPRIGGRRTSLWCAWLAWSRFG
jgi:hypothetical protein